MTLINNHMQPLDLGEQRAIFDDVLISREQDLEVARANLVLRILALVGGALVGNHLDRGGPFLEFRDPVGHGREGNDDEVGAVLLFGFDEEGNEREGLDRFAESLFERAKENGQLGSRRRRPDSPSHQRGYR